MLPKIISLGSIIEEAMELERMLGFIDFMEGSDETTKNLQELSSLLETDSTTYNIESIVEYVEENKKSIKLKYDEVCKETENG